MPGISRVSPAVQLQRSEPGVAAKVRGGDLVGGNGVVEALARNRELVGAGEPEGAALVSRVHKPVGQPLEHAEVRLVPGQRLEPLRNHVVRPGLLRVWKPRLRGQPPAQAQKNQALGTRRSRGGGGETAEPEGFQKREGDERGAGAQELTAGGGQVHGATRVIYDGKVRFG